MAEESERQCIYVGVDWASKAHQGCVLDAEGKELENVTFAHEGEAITAWIDSLLERAKGASESILVAIETPQSAVVEMLLERSIAVYAINPKQLDRLRDRSTVAGAKDDRRDARVLAQSLRTDRGLFRLVKLGTRRRVLLRELVRIHDELRIELYSHGNRLGELLRRFYPAMLELGSIYDNEWVWDLLELAPTPDAARRVSRSKVKQVLRQRRVRRLDEEQVLAILRAPALGVPEAVAEACAEHIRLILPRLRLVSAQRKAVLARLDALIEAPPTSNDPEEQREHRDATILLSWPGVGTLVCATMLAEAGQPLGQRDYANLRLYCGLAPVTRQSGQRRAVVMRRACNRLLRNAMHHLAHNALKTDMRAKAHYAALRAKGHSVGRALRGVADRLLEGIVVSLSKGELYDTQKRQIAA